MSLNDGKIDIKIRPITIEDQLKVFQFLQNTFYKDEPMNQTFENGSNVRFEDSASIQCIGEGLSFMAVKDDSGTVDSIVGVIINSEHDTETINHINNYVAKLTNPNVIKILSILKKVMEESDIFSKINADKTFSHNNVSVDQRYRGLNIGQRLFEASLQLARTKGYEYASVECTSAFSAVIVEKLGFKCVYSLAYNDFKDEFGDVVFKTQSPHTHIHVFIKKL